jgi:hypothetical protein
LEKLGFPWILSSESSLINELREIFCGNIFALLPGRQGAVEPPLSEGGRQCPRRPLHPTARYSGSRDRGLSPSIRVRSFAIPEVPHSPAARSFWQENVGTLIHGLGRCHHAPPRATPSVRFGGEGGVLPFRRSRWMDCFVASLLATTRGGVALYPWETKRRHCERSEAIHPTTLRRVCCTDPSSPDSSLQ